MVESGDNNKETTKSGLGDLLKSSREKKGFNREDMVRIVRLRRHFVVALEEEDWEALPSPVFVKGFIRSYLKALGVDSSKALDLYKKTAPKKDESPRPLVTQEKSVKSLIFFCILFVTLLIILIYLWINYSRVAEISPEPDITATTEANIVEEEKIPSITLDRQESMENEDLSVDDKKSEANTVSIINTGPVIPDNEELAESEEPAQTGESQEPEQINLPVVPLESESLPEADPADRDSTLSEPETETGITIPGSEERTYPLSLTGMVSMRTYVKIYIDDNLPKEYIFQPGARPQWEAVKGFDIVVGNAAGIIFDFNGKLIQDLGGSGKVVRIRLPEDFESKLYGD